MSQRRNLPIGVKLRRHVETNSVVEHATKSTQKPKLDLTEHRRQKAENRLINAESALGRTVFGTVMDGYKREFFCLKKNVWIWYENGTTMRYEVRENGVYKRVNEGKYAKISDAELANFRAATKAYLTLLHTHLYK